MKKYNLKIGSLLIVGFSVLIFFVLVLGVISYYETREMQNQMEVMYEHPFLVQKAVDNLQTNILKMRLETRNLLLAKTKTDQETAIRNIRTSAAHLDIQFDIIRKNYLGPKEDVEEAFDAFVEWNTAREENIEKAIVGDLDYVIESVKDTGKIGSLRNDMILKINKIDKFQNYNANAIYLNSNSLKDSLNLITVIIVTFMLLIAVVIIYLLIRQIRRPISELAHVAENLSNGIYEVRATNIPDNEFKVLSDTFNTLAEHLKSEVELHQMEVSLASIMLSDDDEIKFFNKLLPALAGFTNSQLVAVYLLSDDRQKLEHYMSIGTDEVARKSFDTQNYEGELGAVLLSKRIQTIKNIPLDTRFVFNTTSGKLVPREILTLPIVSGNEVVAVISMASVRNYSQITDKLIDKFYDTLNARIVGILTLMKLKEYSVKLSNVSKYNRNLIDASIDPFFAIDSGGKITDVNIATEKITGIQREKLLLTDFQQIFAIPEKAFEVYREVYSQGFVRNVELQIKHISGKLIPVLFNGTVYRNHINNEQGVFATTKDNSEAKRFENELIKLNDFLTQRSEELNKLNLELESQKTALSNQSIELSQQNTLLEAQKSQLNEANKLKSNFLSNMSHELRTPLNSVIALSGVLGRRLKNKIPDEEFSFLNVIERNGRHLLGLINDILDISRIEAGKVEIVQEKIDLNELIADLTEMIKPQATEKKIELTHKFPSEKIVVLCDSMLCNHVLQNLLSNAVKFTEKGQVTIEAKIINNDVHIMVVDTGIGIAPENLDHIFDEFRQADNSTSRKYGGTGLGLSIASKYAKMLGGKIIVESKPEVGSVFTFVLQDKLIENVENNKNILPKSVDIITKSTILIVEDSEPAVIQLNDFLMDTNFRVLTAGNGQQALDILVNTVPDAIILDLMMPGIDGFDVLKKIRENEKTENIPVLILTAKHLTKEDLSFLKKNHIYQLVQKGEIKRKDLLKMLNDMIFSA